MLLLATLHADKSHKIYKEALYIKCHASFAYLLPSPWRSSTSIGSAVPSSAVVAGVPRSFLRPIESIKACMWTLNVTETKCVILHVYRDREQQQQQQQQQQ